MKPTRRIAFDGRDSVWLTSVHPEGANRSRPRGLYGVKNIHLAIFLTEFFRDHGIDVELDIGQQGWPITLWIEQATSAKSRRLIIETFRTIDFDACRLRFDPIRTESVRVTAARVGSQESASACAIT